VKYRTWKYFLCRPGGSCYVALQKIVTGGRDVEFRVGSITAECAKCGATSFETLAHEAPGDRSSKFCCSRCKALTTYSELIQQIGRRSKERRATAPARSYGLPSESASRTPAAMGLVIKPDEGVPHR
jgi:predicted nucleic-acid-binding Zn-ribbon protein